MTPIDRNPGIKEKKERGTEVKGIGYMQTGVKYRKELKANESAIRILRRMGYPAP